MEEPQPAISKAHPCLIKRQRNCTAAILLNDTRPVWLIQGLARKLVLIDYAVHRKCAHTRLTRYERLSSNGSRQAGSQQNYLLSTKNLLTLRIDT